MGQQRDVGGDDGDDGPRHLRVARQRDLGFADAAADRPRDDGFEAGGRIAIEPMQAHGTRVALLIDPTGAPLAIAEWQRK